ncbi:MAG: cupin domain-containing protein [Candidatus Omnitrophica bacterium]|nr:cupin domain-containing protein [Candidatus Omnitrophota bacterium]MBU4488523.1 cupin domain-containing protein [Candidatus Omnitrophota bacterium]MCG2704565.1 cupin domain-containing protein [Candidatus Omnitrophota bacterium]
MAETKKILKLTDAVDCQDGSIVSKEIVKGKTGGVTLFAFDKGQGLSEHTAPFDALVYIMDGEAAITISGKVFNPKAGDFIIMPANEPHSVKAVNRFKMMLVMIKS